MRGRAPGWFVVVLTGALVVAGVGPAAVAAPPTPVDVVFLVDRSPSMAAHANNTTAAAGGFANELEARGADGRYAVIAYANANWTRLQTAFTGDPDAAESGVASITYGQSSAENASLAILSALEAAYGPDLALRADAATVVVVFTDEDDDGYCALGADAIAALDSRGAMLVAVARDPPLNPRQAEGSCLEDPAQNDLRVIAEEQVAHGRWTDPAAPDFAGVLDWLGLGSTGSPGDERAEPQAEFDRVGASLNRSAVAVGEPVGVAVTVENVGDGPGTYHAVLTGDMAMLGTRDVRLDPGENHTFRWVVSFDEPEPQIRLFESYRHIGDVRVTEAAEPPSPTSTPTVTPPTATRTVTATPVPTEPAEATGTATARATATAVDRSPPVTAPPVQTVVADAGPLAGIGFDLRYLLVLVVAAALLLLVVRRPGL